MSMGHRLFSVRKFLAGVMLIASAGCGFQLRGAYDLPYETLFVSVPESSVVGAGLKRHIRASGGTRLVDDPKEAQATFQRAGEKRDTVILSLSASGRVREKRLRYQYSYRIVDSQGRDLVPQGYVELTRDVTYADSAPLAKTQEENLLWRDMENDLVQQLLRRLATAKPKPAAETD
jgi:LPS-assembly lipoprotein